MSDLLGDSVPDFYACAHTHQQATRFTMSNGVETVRIQCKRCGGSLGNKRKADYNLAKLPAFDRELAERWNRECGEKRNAFYEKQRAERESLYVAEKAEKDRLWWHGYSAYLRTQKWHTMRQAILKRDNYLCQACLRNKADQVHHLSYELYNALGRSAAFELVAICRSCHEKIHPHMADEQTKAAFYNPYLPEGAR